MTTAEAEDLWCEARGIMDSLRKDFPCTECDGTGDKNPENYPYPDICEECWGRGFSIPDEDDE